MSKTLLRFLALGLCACLIRIAAPAAADPAFDVKDPNCVMAGPASGVAKGPLKCRALVPADVAALVQPSTSSLGATNLVGSSAGSAKTASWTADELTVKTALGGTPYQGTSLSLSFNGGATGAGGMDTGSTPTSGSLYVYAIYNPTGNAWATLGTTAGAGSVIYSGTHMPGSYTASVLLGAVVTDGSGNLPKFTQIGTRVTLGTRVTIFTGVTLTTSWASQSIAAAVPANAKFVSGTMGCLQTMTINQMMGAAADSNGADENLISCAQTTIALDGFFGQGPYRDLQLITAQTIWVIANVTSTNRRLDVTGYRF